MPASDPIPTALACKKCGLSHGVKCTAHKRSGKPCTQPRMKGAVVCRMHGGSAPQVRRSARERLAAMVDPALDVLYRNIKPTKGKYVKPELQARCAFDVLDRAGLKAKDEVVLTQQFSVSQFQHLSDEDLEQLINLARKATIPTAVHEGEVIAPKALTDGSE